MLGITSSLQTSCCSCFCTKSDLGSSSAHVLGEFIAPELSGSVNDQPIAIHKEK